MVDKDVMVKWETPTWMHVELKAYAEKKFGNDNDHEQSSKHAVMWDCQCTD